MFWINVESVYAKYPRPYWCVGSSSELPLRTPLIITNRSGREHVVWLSGPVKGDDEICSVPKGVFAYHIMNNREVIALWAHMARRAGEPGSKADRIIRTMDSLQAGLVAASSTLEKLVAALPKKAPRRRPTEMDSPVSRSKKAPKVRKPAKKVPRAPKPASF